MCRRLLTQMARWHCDSRTNLQPTAATLNTNTSTTKKKGLSFNVTCVTLYFNCTCFSRADTCECDTLNISWILRIRVLFPARFGLGMK